MRRLLTVTATTLFSAAVAASGLLPGMGELNGTDGVVRSAGSCGLAQPALCEPFDAPSPLGVGTRSGNLDGVLWGVSRATNNDNPSQGQLFAWSATSHSTCGSAQPVAPEQDVLICNGQLVESVSDAGQDTILALYPRQPFDIAGRTGIATFDVNNDTQGPHAAWPAFVYTDQPVPAPYGQAAGLADTPRNSFGFSLATPNCNGDPSLTGVDSMWTTTNYQLAQQAFSTLGCVRKATNTTQLNHFEVHLSQSHVEVWGTDPGLANLHQLASATLTMPLSRGLIWIEDVHYNACKFNTQCTHTFVWDNVGFDGPVLPRDLGFDLLDATHSGSTGGNLGYLVPANGSLSLQIPNVTDVQNASAALLEFTFWPHAQDSFSYAVNGHPAHSQPWPFGPNGITFSSQTIALPVPLDELHDGANSVVLTSSDTSFGGVSVANIDLILVAAGGTPASGSGSVGGGAPGIATPVPLPTSAATPTPTPVLSPPITQLVGVSTIQNTVDRNPPGMAEAFQYTATASGSARHISLYVDSRNAAAQIVLGIYSHNASRNSPGGLLAKATLSRPRNGAWNTIAIPAVQITSGSSYWISILAPSTTGTVQFRDTASGSRSLTSSQVNLTTLPTTWSTGATWSSGPASIYLAN